ncbi:MAG TPA: hypothetical protein VF707_10165 [Ardenticatenaceae bacterium]|jgi:hypothetical protein
MNRELTYNWKWTRAMLGRIALLFVLLAPSVARAEEALPEPPPVRDERFGAVEAYTAPDVALSAGVGWTRALFWWHQVQRTGPDDWNPYFFPDGLVHQELDGGRQLVGLLAGTPDWASEGGTVRDVPSGLYLPYDDPNNYWGRFVYRMAHKYRGEIDHWIIWNEPDVWDDAHPGKTWNGTVEEYVQLLKVAYQAAKAANPDAVIHLTAMTYWWDQEYGREQYLTRLLRAIRAEPTSAAHNGFFDVASLHIYFSPEQVYNVTGFFRGELERFGFGGKPLWINETNAPPSEDPLHPAPGLRFPVSLEEQGYFLVQAWAMGLSAGAERVSLYKTRDEPTLLPGVEPYGLQRRDGSLRPAFWTYRTLVTYLGGYTNAQLTREGNTRRVVISRGARGTTTVVWNMGTAAQAVRVPATAGSALLVDAFGPMETIRPTGGFYMLTLPPSRGTNLGGAPFLIVEGAGAAVTLERPAHLPRTPMLPAQPPAPPSATPPPANPGPQAGDWAIPNGRFFTQAAGGQGGFGVVDDGQARFWSEFQRLGGLQTVGYPISRRFTYDGFVTQAFQKLVLQWRPEANQAWPVNVFDELSKAGRDPTLLQTRQTPRPLANFDAPNASWQQIVTARQALLNDNPAIRARYFSVADPLNVFGLPTSRVEDMGNHFAIRTQRAVFQQWKEAVPWAAAGQVTIANGGDIAKELNWLPANALQPEPPP